MHKYALNQRNLCIFIHHAIPAFSRIFIHNICIFMHLYNMHKTSTTKLYNMHSTVISHYAQNSTILKPSIYTTLLFFVILTNTNVRLRHFDQYKCSTFYEHFVNFVQNAQKHVEQMCLYCANCTRIFMLVHKLFTKCSQFVHNLFTTSSQFDTIMVLAKGDSMPSGRGGG